MSKEKVLKQALNKNMTLLKSFKQTKNEDNIEESEDFLSNL